MLVSRRSSRAALLVLSLAVSARAQTDVPKDLKPLLTPKRSEMRLVITRYTADRSLLSGNYAGGSGRGGGGGGGGRAGGAGATALDSIQGPAVTVSRARIARLKRYGMSWQAALDRLPTASLSAEAQADLDRLKGMVRDDLLELDKEAAAIQEVATLLPFSARAIPLIESRLRLEDVKARQAAGAIDSMRKEITAVRDKIAAAMTGKDSSVAPLKANRAQALRAAAEVEILRGNLAQWFGFYDGYDPVFTWWMGVPWRRAEATMRSYAAFLRDTVAAANMSVPAANYPTRVDPAPPPKYPEVPDLLEIINLPQDEMTDIVQRFRTGRGGGGGGGRGGGTGAAPQPGSPARDSAYYRDWLTALQSLDFDALTRNAQVDYLYIRRTADVGLARVGKTLPANNPRKTDNTGIPGAARGREGLLWDLEDEMIPYTPEQLIVLAEKEFVWHEAEMKKASRQMGFGDNWRAALEKTKQMHVEPGEQPGMIRDLIYEAIDFLRAKDLVTVPEVGAESQRMSMMSAQQQLSSPFFLGGAQILVSYPTNEMEYDTRMQSMRGNNRPWSHATAFHEMIPGHNLVGYMGQRFNGYRPSLGGGPFFGEGWPLYWELTMYDKGFHDTPEEKVGALFWRMHRCARIIFSLKFHMGQWSPQEAIDFLVDRVGHERDNATAEVRRSFQGGYGPLYQAAYLLGGMQLNGLRREVVNSKQMTEKAFHDEILRQGSMPITLIRFALTKEKLTRDMPLDWKFYGELPDR